MNLARATTKAFSPLASFSNSSPPPFPPFTTAGLGRTIFFWWGEKRNIYIHIYIFASDRISINQKDPPFCQIDRHVIFVVPTRPKKGLVWSGMVWLFDHTPYNAKKKNLKNIKRACACARIRDPRSADITSSGTGIYI